MSNGPKAMEVDGQLKGRPLRVYGNDDYKYLWEDGEQSEDWDDCMDDSTAMEDNELESDAAKTKAVNDTDAAANSPPVKIRFVFREGLVCETEFSASESVTEIFAFLWELILPQLKEDAQLFTGPPKKILTNLNQTLTQAKLTPSADLFVESKRPDFDMPPSALRDTIFDMRKDLKPAGVAVNQGPTNTESVATVNKRNAGSPPPEFDTDHIKWFRMN